MNTAFMRMMQTGLMAAALGLAALHPALAQDTPKSTSSFNGKIVCQNGMKKAGFKDPDTNNVTYYTLNEVAHQEQALSWPEPNDPMSFDAREERKTQLQHVMKMLRDFSCDTQDNPAESTGLNPGVKNGIRENGYVPLKPEQPLQ